MARPRRKAGAAGAAILILTVCSPGFSRLARKKPAKVGTPNTPTMARHPKMRMAEHGMGKGMEAKETGFGVEEEPREVQAIIPLAPFPCQQRFATTRA
jgi:hypothetical protein